MSQQERLMTTWVQEKQEIETETRIEVGLDDPVELDICGAPYPCGCQICNEGTKCCSCNRPTTDCVCSKIYFTPQDDMSDRI